MNSFAPLAFIDCWELQCSLKPRLHLFPAADEWGRRVFSLRRYDSESETWKVSKELGKWVELRNMLSRIEREGEKIAPDTSFERGAIWLEMLEPGCGTPWQQAPAEWLRLHLALRTNPAALMFAGGESHHLFPGQLTLVRPALASAINLGEMPRVHLTIEVRQRDQNESQQ